MGLVWRCGLRGSTRVSDGLHVERAAFDAEHLQRLQELAKLHRVQKPSTNHRCVGEFCFPRAKLTSEMKKTKDDHDYGLNNGGEEYPDRALSQKLFLNFLDEPADSPRWQREGLYASHVYGPRVAQVRFILLDARYFRGETPNVCAAFTLCAVFDALQGHCAWRNAMAMAARRAHQQENRAHFLYEHACAFPSST
jgi:hypothetical protein